MKSSPLVLTELEIAVPILPQGSYYLQERTTNGSYILNDTKYPVIFTYAGQDIATVRLAANDGQAIINELIYGSVSGKSWMMPVMP